MKKNNVFNTPLKEMTIGQVLSAYGWMWVVILGILFFTQLIMFLVSKLMKNL